MKQVATIAYTNAPRTVGVTIPAPPRGAPNPIRLAEELAGETMFDQGLVYLSAEIDVNSGNR